MRTRSLRSRFAALLFVVPSAALAAQQEAPAPPPAARLLGFGDFNYVATNRAGPEGFLEGQVAGHLAAELTTRLSFFSEVTATPTPAGFNLEVERAILRYDFSDRVKLSAGRYHTPLGYWNTAFHHGQWLQTTGARPELVKFGGRFIPVHFVGAMAEGTVPLGAVDLRYALGAGNGRHTNIARGGDAGDVNDRRAWTAAVRSRLHSVPSLEVGAALYFDRVNPVAGVAVNERLLAAHVVWDGQQPEVLAEYVHARHAVAGGGPRAVSEAGYIQVAYRLTGRAKVLKPYARAERIDVPAADPLLGTLGMNYRAVIAGLRYDFAPIAALKLEYRAEKPQTPSWFDTVVAQLSFTFPGWHEEGPLRAWSHPGGTRCCGPRGGGGR